MVHAIRGDVGFPVADATGTQKNMLYTDVKDRRIVISMNLPSGFKVAHQIV